MAIKIIISSNHVILQSALHLSDTFAVVEAEYGSNEIEGSSDLLTLNHHIRPDRPCPCSLENEDFDNVRETIEAVGISHFDLDTLGGLMALLGVKPEARSFWQLAEWIDTRGPHRIRESSDYSEENHILLASFWAWAQKNRLFPSRDGSITDCTEFVREAIIETEAILSGDPERIARGEKFLGHEASLKTESFVRKGESESGLRVVLRKADVFVNHLYYGDDDNAVDVVVGYSDKFKSVTVSRAGDEVELVAKDFVQELWGELAGGHAGIAGSPRGQELALSEAERAFEALLNR